MTNYDILKEYEAHQTSMPSYKEWKDLKSKLQLKETAYDFDTARLEAENAQLKELLKQAETQIIAYKNNDTLPERALYEKEVEELLGKIDEVLKC